MLGGCLQKWLKFEGLVKLSLLLNMFMVQIAFIYNKTYVGRENIKIIIK
jgi:hypothetical protein